MSFSSVVGQEQAKGVLRQAILTGRIPQALLLTGPKGSGKAALALALARALNCAGGGPEPCETCSSCGRIGTLTHPDVHVLFPGRRSRREGEDLDPEEERKFLAALARDPYRYPEPGPSETILIDRVRRLEQVLARGRFEGRFRVAVFLMAERMRQETANALLKTLEEPLPATAILLATAQPDSLLPTIHSRCQRLRLQPLSQEEVAGALAGRGGMPEARVRLIARLSQGSLRAAYDMAEQDVEASREEAYRFLHDGLLGGDTALFPTVEKLGAGAGDRRAAEGLFAAAGLWLRDVALLHAGRTGALTNVDRTEDVCRLAEVLGTEGVRAAMGRMEECRDMSRRNVNLSLIMITFWRHLRRYRRTG